MKIAFFEIEEWERDYIKSKLKKHKLIFINDKLNKENVKLVLDCEIISVFIYSKIDKDLIKIFEKLNLDKNVRAEDLKKDDFLNIVDNL